MKNVIRTIASIGASKGREEDLVRRYRPDVYRLALAITSSTDAAEDVAQEVCCRLHRSQETLAKADQPWAWVRKVTVNCAVDALQRRRSVQLDKETLAHLPDPNEALAVAHALSRLSQDHRTILALSIYEGLSYQEIADTLDIPMGSVASRIHNAKQRFREIWEEA